MTILLGDEQELRRQAKEIDYLDTFLQYQQEGDSMECVYTWHVHQHYQEKLADFEFFRKNIDVLVDAKIEGSLKVIEDINKPDDSIKKGMMSKQSSPTKQMNSSPKRPVLPPRQSEAILQAPYAPSAELAPIHSQFASFGSTLGMVILINRSQISPEIQTLNEKPNAESQTFSTMPSISLITEIWN